MTTLWPRALYSDEELAKLYPQSLELRQVQILLRHGERTPVAARFKNAGLPGTWSYCHAANELKSTILAADGSWTALSWKRRLETFGPGDIPVPATGPSGLVDAVCQPGELTDRGRETTLALGQRIRTLYVDQLGFLPSVMDDQTQRLVRLRATPIPRALESVQQVYSGLYPASSRSPGLLPPTIVQRLSQDETLFPNEGSCKRFAELAHAFAARAAQLWNDSAEMKYINSSIGKWMPKDSPEVKVDSHPRLSGIMDTVNATIAHGRPTRLPAEFYNEKMRSYMDRICVDEWFAGYQESAEYRKLGIGGLIGDLTQRMVEHVDQSRGSPHNRQMGRDVVQMPQEASATENGFQISLAGCHDTTIAATLSALGGFEGEKRTWPRFTSNLAFELFHAKESSGGGDSSPSFNPTIGPPHRENRWWWSSLLSPFTTTTPSTSPAVVARTPLVDRSDRFDGYYVRLRYNDVAIPLPFCRVPGRHWDGDESLCTLAAFKEAADRVTPKDWKRDCQTNLGTCAFPNPIEPPPGVLVAP